MIMRSSASRWQTVIADLSLILFLVAASALDDDAPENQQVEESQEDKAHDEPPVEIAMSVWQYDPRGVSLALWLSEQPAHDAQRVSISISYKTGELGKAVTRLDQIQGELGENAHNARVIMNESDYESVRVRLVQDDAFTGNDSGKGLVQNPAVFLPVATTPLEPA